MQNKYEHLYIPIIDKFNSFAKSYKGNNGNFVHNEIMKIYQELPSKARSGFKEWLKLNKQKLYISKQKIIIKYHPKYNCYGK